jgi:hypothetical protein
MTEVEIPGSLHESVKDYAQRHGLSVPEAYAELVEYALNNIDGERDDEDPRSGIA